MAWHNTKARVRSPRAPVAFIDPCLPTKVSALPSREQWAHEIKHDGYRIQIHVRDAGVRVDTMSGYDWTVKAATMLDGKYVRPAPWIRRRMLKKLLGRRALGLSYSKEIVGRGPEVYQAACRMGLEGIVSKRIEAPYKSGKVKTWLKIKNPDAPGAMRFAQLTKILDAFVTGAPAGNNNTGPHLPQAVPNVSGKAHSDDSPTALWYFREFLFFPIGPLA
jgi:bifunctional non-homologous end joining protein LigD